MSVEKRYALIDFKAASVKKLALTGTRKYERKGSDTHTTLSLTLKNKCLI